MPRAYFAGECPECGTYLTTMLSERLCRFRDTLKDTVYEDTVSEWVCTDCDVFWQWREPSTMNDELLDEEQS